MRRWRRTAVLCATVSAGGLTACELNEVTLAESEDVPVVEAYVQLGDGQDQTSVFLHWTLGTRPARDFLDAEVVVTRDDGEEILMAPGDPDQCLRPGLEDLTEGVCFAPGFDVEGFFQAGMGVSLTVALSDGGVLEAATMIPEDIQFLYPVVRERCALGPGRQLEFVWNRSPGVWAYSAETEILGLRDALALEQIQVETDSVALLGLAVSDSDTTITFPREFGIFDRFDLEQEVALALQNGLPVGAVATVVVAALDRNYVNWIRGGNFNPSGPVRVSSIRGPGVGVLGSTVRRTIFIRGIPPNLFPQNPLPDCLTRP